MKCRLNGVVMLVAGASLVLAACSSDNGGGGGSDASTGGSSGSGGGSSTGGKTSTGGTSSSTGGTKSTGGTTSTGGTKSTGGTSGSGGTSTGGAATGGTKSMTDAGPDANTSGDAGDPALIARGKYLVTSVALCGGCHTDRSGTKGVLGGNATFVTGLPAPNLTSDATGLKSWTNTQIKNAFRNGVDSDGKPLSPTMPYQLFHNMSDADADAIVAYLRSLTPVNNDVGERTVTVTAAATPFDPATFPPPEHTNPDSGIEEADAGFYLVTSIAQCAKCHTPVNATTKALNLSLTTTFTGGAPTATATATTPAGYYAPNITPDATGIKGWTADDVVTFLKTGAPKGGGKVCGSMPVGPTGGYGGLTDADAHAIGVYLTTIAPIANAAADPASEPACP